MTYETLDNIADAYIPLLAILAFGCMFFSLRFSKVGIQVTVNKFFRILGLIALVYGLMYLDSYLEVFPYFGLDYSTHTALSLVLTCYLSWAHKKYRVYYIVVFLMYLLLMLYQRYHTVEDIVVTGLVVFPFTLLILRRRGGKIG